MTQEELLEHLLQGLDVLGVSQTPSVNTVALNEAVVVVGVADSL